MKAIQVPASLEKEFLKAAQVAQLEVTQLRKIISPGKVFYQVHTRDENKIFRLGVLFTFQVLNSRSPSSGSG